MNVLSKNEHSQLLEMIYSCVHCTSLEELSLLTYDVTDLLQSGNLVFLTARGNYQASPDLINELNISYPTDWIQTYRSRDYTSCDPLVAKGLSGLLFWQDVYDKYQPDQEFLSAAQSFGIINGFSHIQISGNHFGLMSIADKSLKNSDRNRMILSHLAPHLHLLVDKLMHRQEAQKVKILTKREREILLWIIEGKTNWETSVILNIGEESVKSHMANILEKLGASNRTHAASIALQNNMLYSS